MKIHGLLLIVLFISPWFSWGQASVGNNLGIAMYGNLLQEDQATETFNLTNGQTLKSGGEVQSFTFGHFSPAFLLFHANQHLSEIELSFLRFDREDVVRVTELSGPFPGTTQAFSLGIRYAYNFNLLTGMKSVVRPHLGLSVLPYMQVHKTKPESKVLYTTDQTDLAILSQIIPRLIIQFSDFIYLDVNAPISILEVKQQKMLLKNGGQQLPDIKESRTNLSWVPKKLHLRVGLGVMF